MNATKIIPPRPIGKEILFSKDNNNKNIRWVKIKILANVYINTSFVAFFMITGIMGIMDYFSWIEGGIVINNIYDLLMVLLFFFGISVLITWWFIVPSIKEYEQLIK